MTGWKQHRLMDPSGATFGWTAELTDGLRGDDEDREWPFSLLSPEGRHMHMSEAEELNAFVSGSATAKGGLYDLGYTDEDGGWWWVALRHDGDGDLLACRRVAAEETASWLPGGSEG